MQQIGEPDAIRLRDKHYFLMPASATDLAGEENLVPRNIDTRPEGHALLMTIGDDLEKARTLNLLKEVTLKLGIEGITPEVDEWDVTINGRLVPRDRQKCDPDSVVFTERWIEIDLTAGPYPIPGTNEI